MSFNISDYVPPGPHRRVPAGKVDPGEPPNMEGGDEDDEFLLLAHNQILAHFTTRYYRI